MLLPNCPPFFVQMYWITISNGLLEKKHHAQIGSAVWEFMWLIDKMTDTIDGKVLGGKPINLKDISNDLGISERSISANLNKLKKEGYIRIIRTPRGLSVRVENPKKFFQKEGSDRKQTTSDRKQTSEVKDRKQTSDAYIDNTVKDNTKTYTKLQDVINYFFELKGWANKDKQFYKKKEIIYSRFVRPAKDLLELCDNNLDDAKECIKKIADWANSRELDWGIETVFKKWYDLDLLKPKAKKPYYDNCRIFQKSEGGKKETAQILKYGDTREEDGQFSHISSGLSKVYKKVENSL